MLSDSTSHLEVTQITEITKRHRLFSFVSVHIVETNPFDWFYTFNVEGFAGLACLLTYEMNQGGITNDFGLSNISVLFQFIPYSLRFSENLPFKDMKEFFSSLYPYDGRTIPSGMENAYANFGLLGLLGLGIFLAYLMKWLHKKMLNPRADRLLIGILSFHSLQLIRGSFCFAIFFGLSEIIMLSVYRSILRLPNMMRNLREQNHDEKRH